MLLYPQLGSGALSQFPVEKRRRLRTVRNVAADGRWIKLADEPGEYTEWSLHYAGLSDAEVAALEQFFREAEGTLNSFTFVDPTDNLLAWSDDLESEAWQAAPWLSTTSGISDPAGGVKGWRLANSGAAAQSLIQMLSAPAGYLYCLSVYVRAQDPVTVTMLLGEHRAIRVAPLEWTRIEFASAGDPAGESIAFGLEVPAGGALDVYGLQSEPQCAASTYKASTRGGVHRDARLRDDCLAITTTGVNCHSSTVNIIHANHL